MSRAEVEAILGPPGDYRTRPTGLENGVPMDLGDPLKDGETVLWCGDAGSIVLVFNREGTVTTVGFGDRVPKPSGPFDTLLWRAKLLWRRWFPE
jgi:hypothetical protein